MKRGFHKGDCARRAAQALHAFRIAAGDCDDEEAIRDLVTDLGHFADRHHIDFLDVMATAIGFWALEQKDRQGILAAPSVTITIGQHTEGEA